MTGLPSGLLAALNQRPADRITAGTSAHRPYGRVGRVGRGDIRSARPLLHQSGEARLVLVLGVHQSDEFAEVLLVHTAPEMACEVDVVLPTSTTSTPYDLVVQTDLRSVVWTVQLGSAVGHLDERAMAVLNRVAADGTSGETALDDPDLDPLGYVGTPLAGPVDRRWSFKESEGTTLRALASDCTSALLDRGTLWHVAPGLFQPELLDRVEDREAFLYELLHWLTTRDLTLTAADLEFLDAVGVFSFETWESLGDIGLDLWGSVKDLMMRTPAAQPASDDPDGSRMHLLTATQLRDRRQDTDLEVIHYIGQKEVVPA